MKAYLDTNVLVAASVEAHPHHAQSFELVKAIKNRKITGYISTHGLLEFYSVITRAPFSPRVHPAEASRFLDDNILPYFELVVLSGGDYKAVLRSCSASGFTGGVVFDALHLHSAQKAGCDRIYTFNLRDFRALATKEMKVNIASP